MATVVIEDNLLKTIKKIAKREGISEDKALNKIIKKGIMGTERKEDVFNRLERLTNGKIKIANKNTYNPNPTEEELNSIIGLAEAPSEDFDIVKAVEDANVRKGE